jgi:hypothetical protein
MIASARAEPALTSKRMLFLNLAVSLEAAARLAGPGHAV